MCARAVGRDRPGTLLRHQTAALDLHHQPSWAPRPPPLQPDTSHTLPRASQGACFNAQDAPALPPRGAHCGRPRTGCRRRPRPARPPPAAPPRPALRPALARVHRVHAPTPCHDRHAGRLVAQFGPPGRRSHARTGRGMHLSAPCMRRNQAPAAGPGRTGPLALRMSAVRLIDQHSRNGAARGAGRTMVALPPQYRPPREAFMAGRIRPSGVTTSYSGIACAQKSGLRACTITCAARTRAGVARALPYPTPAYNPAGAARSPPRRRAPSTPPTRLLPGSHSVLCSKTRVSCGPAGRCKGSLRAIRRAVRRIAPGLGTCTGMCTGARAHTRSLRQDSGAQAQDTRES
jgi:hypothetical protein